MKFQKLSRADCIISHKVGLIQFWKSKQCPKSQRGQIFLSFWFWWFFKFILQIPYFIARSQGNETKLSSVLIYLMYHLEESYKNPFWMTRPPEFYKLDVRLCLTWVKSTVSRARLQGSPASFVQLKQLKASEKLLRIPSLDTGRPLGACMTG